MAHDLKISANAKSFNVEGGSRLEVFDENNKLIYQGEFKSFTSNFLKLLYGSMLDTAGAAKVKDISGNNIEMNTLPQDTMNISGGAGVDNFGVVVGRNSTAVVTSDYNISMPAGLTLGSTVLSASSVDMNTDSISVEISRQINNSTGSDISFKEAGLICREEGGAADNVLIARDLLDLTLENSKKTTWRYTINFNFAADKGGFVKTFADLMFRGLFKEVTASADWTARRFFGCVIFNNNMWIMGGQDSNGLKSDVWHSEDGITWTRATASAGWTARRNFGCVVFQDKMWVMGGYDSSAKNDVWYSTNGITWTQVHSVTVWPVRYSFQSCVFRDKMWVMGGYDSSVKNDVWYSTNGITWTQVHSVTVWPARSDFEVIVFKDKMWVVGGNTSSGPKNDVWYSSDGEDWMQTTSSADWAARRFLGCVVFNNKMWIMGGQDSNGLKNDVWYSEDGITWIQAAASANWSARRGFGCVVLQDKMWVLGGDAGTYNDDVWATNTYSCEIKAGTSDTPFSATATALGAEITDGTESGQLIYGVMPSPATTEPAVSGNKTTFSLAREFTNNSGADIIVKEVGLFSGTDMLARLILASPVTIANGGVELITVDFETEA